VKLEKNLNVGLIFFSPLLLCLYCAFCIGFSNYAACLMLWFREAFPATGISVNWDPEYVA
jgi:hypothetical protein